MEDATIMASSDDHSEDSSEASPAMSPAALTAASTAPSEDTRLAPLFGNVNYNPAPWRNFVTPEPISDELREKVRMDLRKEWYSSRLCPYFRRMTQANWVLFDHCRIVLDSELGEIDTQHKAQLFCNKPSGFYWSRDLLEAGTPSWRTNPPNTIFASIFGEWHRLYDNQPNLDFGHFVANPIRITEGGPDTIRGIIKAHISLCAKAEGIICGEIHRPGSDVNSAPPAGDFSIHPLYPALVLICDRDELSEVYLDYKRPDGYVRLRDFMHLQSLIIARTGWEHMLSQPISFESLQSKALPLDRADFDGRANVDVIRVPLPDAIRFVVDLEKREDAFIFQKSGSKKNPVPFRVSLDQCLHHHCSEVFRPKGGCCGDQQQWADQHIAAGEEHGYKHCLHLVEALRRVQAEMKNETYTTLAPMWFKAKMVDDEGELGAQF
jgi:hypothetical protein